MKNNKQSVSILLVDDHEVVLSGVTKLLSNNPRYSIAGKVKNKQQAISILQTFPIDVAIIDLALPEFEGLELHNIIKEYAPAAKTIVFSMHESVWVISSLIENGVDGYVSKTSAFSELTIAIEEVLKGNTYFCKKTSETYKIHGLTKNYLQNNQLTRREKDIVNLIYRDLKPSQIAKSLDISKKTVNNHLDIIMRKLKVTSSMGIIRKALQRGIIQPEK